MQSEQSQPSFTQNSPNQQTSPLPRPPRRVSKKLLFIIILVVAVLTGVVAWWFLTQKPVVNNTTGDTPAPSNSTRIVFGQDSKVPSYAGNKQYDACNLIPQTFFEEKLEKYGDVAKALGGEKFAEKPLMVDHGFIDRDVPNIQGDDGVPREPSKSVSETGVDSSVRARSFVNLGDSYCMYGQGATFSTTFATVYVLQPPKPIPQKFTNYLNELKQKGRMVAEVQGVQAFIEEVKPGDSEYATILKKGDVVVVITSPLREILDASDIALANFAKDPAGPMTTTYPKPYGGLISACSLLSASDFERLLGKPSSAVIGEGLALTEISKDVAQRECKRYEIERTGRSEITTARITLMEARTEDRAKQELQQLKERRSSIVATPIDLGDEAYVISDDLVKSITVRIGKRLVQIHTTGETKDANIDAFKNRTLPVAQTVVNNLKK